MKHQVELLLRHEADVNQQNTFGENALHWAAQVGHVPIAKLLLDHNANVFACDTEGNLPIHWACEAGHGHMVRLLASRSSPLEHRNLVNHYSPLDCAIFSGDIDTVESLLDFGVDSASAMSLAISLGEQELVDFFLSKRTTIRIHTDLPP